MFSLFYLNSTLENLRMIAIRIPICLKANKV